MVGAVVPKTAQVCLGGATLARMRRVIVSDYDGTITESSPALLPALRRFLAAGHLFVLCSGRYAEWAEECPLGDVCALLVLENGGCLVDGEGVRELGPAPPPELVEALLHAGYAHDHGRVIVGMRSADEPQVAAILRRYSDDHALIKNKDSLMLLAKGVDKESGARAALAELDVSPDQAIAVGDAENDLALFRACGKTAAVANAVPELKAAADLVLDGEHATGVVELIELVLDGTF